MRNVKEDRRAKYTKMVLKDSLLELLKKKPIEKITVSELAQKADINRATFYIHYYDAFDLLEKTEDEFYDKIMKSFDSPETESFHAILETSLNEIYNNRKLCEVLFGRFGDMKFLEKILSLSGSKVIEFWQSKSPETDISTLELINSFSMGGNTNLVKSWVNNGFKLSVKELLSVMLNLNSKGTDYYIKL